MNGLIWVRLAAGGDAEPPEVMSAAIPDAAQFFWQTRWQAPVVDAIENFLDPLHTHTVHPGLVRCDGVRKPIQVSLRRTPDGFIVNYLGQTEQSGLLYRLFESPRISERAIFAGAGSARIEYRYQNAVRFTSPCTSRLRAMSRPMYSPACTSKNGGRRRGQCACWCFHF